MPSVLGWDVGGVNTKLARVEQGVVRRVVTRPFEVQRARNITGFLRETADLAAADAVVAHGVTMTAELSQAFRTKRDGVGRVLDWLEGAFPHTPIHVYASDGTFLSPAAAREQPLLVAAANWAATAAIVAQHHPDALLIDVGTTTTDVIPIVEGRTAVTGRTDLDRLTSGELVYTGAIRTPVEAIVRDVPVPRGFARVSAEGFALSGDVHLWLGNVLPDDYQAATPDGRPLLREYVAERLARVVCADTEMLDEPALTRLTQAIADEQVRQVRTAIETVAARHPSLRSAVVTGLGAFLGERAARAAGFEVVQLSSQLGKASARSAPAAAVALLLDQYLGSHGLHTRQWVPREMPPPEPDGLTVVKIGGSLLRDAAQWRAALSAIARCAASQRIVIVPGGGPFVDAVRDVDGRIELPDTLAHWMAIAGMNQHADMIAASALGFVRVESSELIHRAHAEGDVPVVAPLSWLRATDPLPHSWDVTSDSIAAWFAGALKAKRLVLVKSSGAAGPGIVDPFFERALPPDLHVTMCDAATLEAHLRAPQPSPG